MLSDESTVSFITNWGKENNLDTRTIRTLIQQGILTDEDLFSLSREDAHSMGLNYGQRNRLYKGRRRLAIKSGKVLEGVYFYIEHSIGVYIYTYVCVCVCVCYTLKNIYAWLLYYVN